MALTSEVHIVLVNKHGTTVLRKAYCTQPFKVIDVTENRKERIIRLMLMTSSPGILDGDDYNITIELEANCAFELQTQSYQRLFSMKNGASQQLRLHLQKDAYFKYLPHPVVPHESSDFVGHSKIFLSENCTLIWGEVLTCGRKLNGEIFRFTRYQAITEIFLNGRLVIKENLFIMPGSIQLDGIGQLEGFTHQATLILLDETISVKELIKQVSDWLKEQQHIMYGITSAPVNGIIIRLLGDKSEQLYDCLKTIAAIGFAPMKSITL